jgi:hypothetical protein
MSIQAETDTGVTHLAPSGEIGRLRGTMPTE